MANLSAASQITVNASPARVWKALTDPEDIKAWLFGTKTTSDWKKGSSITYTGEWEGKKYEDKGTILALEKGKLLKYNYWSSFSGTEDVPANYANIIYSLTPDKSGTVLTITQDNCKSAEARDHSAKNWAMILDNLVKLLAGK
jgi:uncharacterized protein YndB with AHSA1/START domain